MLVLPHSPCSRAPFTFTFRSRNLCRLDVCTVYSVVKPPLSRMCVAAGEMASNPCACGKSSHSSAKFKGGRWGGGGGR